MESVLQRYGRDVRWTWSEFRIRKDAKKADGLFDERPHIENHHSFIRSAFCTESARLSHTVGHFHSSQKPNSFRGFL